MLLKLKIIKTFNYLAGLPRSGGTMLSVLLNQHPDLYVSPLSPVCDYIYNMHQQSFVAENAVLQENITGTDNVLNKFLETYYSDVDSKIIIDREKAWATPGNFELIKKYITLNPKIIFTVRPIQEILISFIKVYGDGLILEMKNNGWYYKNYLSELDNKCDYLMRPFGQIDKIMLSFNEILNKENDGVFHLVEYNDLVNNTQEVMSGISKFLDIDDYKYDINNLKDAHKYNEFRAGLPENMHEVRSVVKKETYDIVLSDYVLSKYSGKEPWN